MQSCTIIRDLLPLYVDGLVSPETEKLVEAHLSHCEACRAFLAQMEAPVSIYRPDEGIRFQQMLKKQKKHNRKKILLMTVLAVLMAALILSVVLWFSDVFWYLGSYVSPDGQTRTRVYRSDVTELVPIRDHFTLVDEGKFQGRTVLWGEFDGLWWSYDSNYQVVSLMDDGECWLTLFDYVRNTGNNLDNRLETSLYGMEEFEKVSLDPDGRKQIEFRFLQWSKFDNSMLIYFSYLDTEGVDRDGYFWYNYDSGDTTGVAHMETLVVDGVVKEQGNDFFLMDRDQRDEDGNIREFVFRISDQTDLRGLETVQPGNHVRLVFHGPEAYQTTIWDTVFGQPARDTKPIAISVTLLE